MATGFGPPPDTPPWIIQQPAGIVISQIEKMAVFSDSTIATAMSIINDLRSIDVGDDRAAPDTNLLVGLESNVGITRPTAPGVLDFGRIDPYTKPGMDTFADLRAQLTAIAASISDPGEFTPSVTGLSIPQAPSPINTGQVPGRPTVNAVQIPVAPDESMPVMGSLVDIDIPAFVERDFPEFKDLDAVEFDGTMPNPVIQWDEPTYVPLVLNEMVARIKQVLAGGTGMTPAVEQALFDQQRTRVDRTAATRERQAFDTWAARGFDMPPGMLVEQVNATQEEARRELNANAREIFTKSAEWEQENLRQAVQHGIALEGMVWGHFNEAASRAFEVQKARVETAVALFGAAIQLFNAKQAARQQEIEIFKAKMLEITTHLEAYKTRIEAESIKSGMNENIVRVFAAQVEAVRAIYGAFRDRIEGVKVQADLEESKVRMYKVDVDAYSALVDADKKRFDAYESQIKGETAKASIVEAEARAFAATVQAQSASSNAKIAAIQGQVGVIGAAVQKFSAEVAAEREKVAASAVAVRAKADAYSADSNRYRAELAANTEETRMAITLTEARLRNHLAFYETRIRQYDAAMTRMIERARVLASALGSAGSMAAQLSAGAMSAMHVQASLSGSASASSNDSYSISHNYSYEGN